MNAIVTIDKIPSVTHLRGITKYQPIGFGLFVNVNEMARTYEDLQSSKSSVKRPNPTLRKEF